MGCGDNQLEPEGSESTLASTNTLRKYTLFREPGTQSGDDQLHTGMGLEPLSWGYNERGQHSLPVQGLAPISHTGRTQQSGKYTCSHVDSRHMRV